MCDSHSGWHHRLPPLPPRAFLCVISRARAAHDNCDAPLLRVRACVRYLSLRWGGRTPHGVLLFDDDDDDDDSLPSQQQGRLVVDPAEPLLAFIGFARPNVGAIPPLAEMQVLWWLSYIEVCELCCAALRESCSAATVARHEAAGAGRGGAGRGGWRQGQPCGPRQLR